MDQEEKVSEIIHSFRDVNRFFYKQMWHHANELGVTIVQLQILKILAENPNISLQELTKKMSSGKSTVSSIVDRLVKAEYVKRERSKEDRRAIVLSLTKLGETKKVEGHTLFIKRLSRLNEIDEADIEKLVELHDLIKEKIKITGDDELEG
ncbi:transcriptional regulator [Virgibacillus phasianinus]|uniref:Transcriptional regulator n=1 Tax=Virgibacillus phasianinus TaxID=2017483 RepID=A0A220U0P8_9BACI|nr:MarR family transcriptional regulator [Virgibacillus phasianinus]ASK61697.1 transcriptional regulator [Virgibacillus phasianinus]